MTTCKRVTELATDYAEGHLRFLDRARVERHLAGCDGCRAFVRQMQVTARALGGLFAPQISAALKERILAGFDEGGKRALFAAVRPRKVRGARLASILAVAAVPAVAITLTHPRAQSPFDWGIASALAVSAVALAALASRFALFAAVAGVSAAFACALITARAGPLAVPVGLHCLAIELAAAWAAATVGFFALGRDRRPGAELALAATAVAGALAADAALELICEVHTSLAHVLVFHGGGVMLAGAVAMLAAKRWLRPAS